MTSCNLRHVAAPAFSRLPGLRSLGIADNPRRDTAGLSRLTGRHPRDPREVVWWLYRGATTPPFDGDVKTRRELRVTVRC